VQWLCGGLSYHVNITPATQQTQRSSEEPVTWPGRVIKLDRLAVLRPNHPAVRYMQIRGFDPMELGRDYGFAFCDKVEDLRYKMAEGTIIMPIWKGDQMFSWISRYVGDTYHGKPLSETPIKKYYNMPGRSLTTLSYNLDQALCYSTIVIVEGVLDCIRTGPYAACLFTKTISQTTKRLILRGLAKYAEEAAVVVMLDPVQNEKDKNRGSLHHIERLASEFHPKYLSRVVRVYLPDGNDPANMTREELREQIERAAREQRVPICLEPKEVYDATVITDRLSRIASARQRLVQNVAYRCRTGSSDDLRNSQNQE
jgi:hypothetical protein